MAHKYRAKPFRDDAGVYWPSRREHATACKLRALADAGAITDLVVGAADGRKALTWKLTATAADGVSFVVESYVADFAYTDGDGNHVVADAKGAVTPDYRRKKKWMERQHGIEIQEL